MISLDMFLTNLCFQSVCTRLVLDQILIPLDSKGLYFLGHYFLNLFSISSDPTPGFLSLLTSLVLDWQLPAVYAKLGCGNSSF